MGRFYSDTLERAVRLIYFQADRTKFPEGVTLLGKAAEAGEPDAYYFLARCYGWEDADVKEDSQKARDLSRRGIELGSDLCVLGAERMDILKGDLKAAMTRSLRDSFQSVVKAAEAGKPMAQYAVGLFYFWGDMMINFQKPASEDFDRCEQENAAEALKWFRLSAEQGCIPAFRNAFNSVRTGLNGTKKDVHEALRWAETVSGKVDLRDYYNLIIGECQDQKDWPAAVRWCKRGIEAGDSLSANTLGLMLLEGRDQIAKDEPEALRLFELGASWGNEYACYNVGRCYYYGWGCSYDYGKAFQYLYKAYTLGHSASRGLLARCYYWGRGTAENYPEAFRLAKALETEGKWYPKEILGLCYLHGRGTPADHARAKLILEDAVKDNGYVWRYLGEMYDKGLGVPEDAPKAAECYQKALKAGCTVASEDLSRFKKTLFGKWKRR